MNAIERAVSIFLAGLVLAFPATVGAQQPPSTPPAPPRAESPPKPGTVNTISDPRATKPLVETRLPSPVAGGVYSVRLVDLGVRLTPGVQYRWFVAVVPDAARRSRDILAGGTIERVDGPEGLRTLVAQASRERLPFIYAEAGLWYDALAAVSELIERAPDNREHRRQRAALLAQVGLPPIDDTEGDKATR